MSFYKLYKIHRRTDIRNWMDGFDRWMRPWYYEKRSEEARRALAQFMAAGALISNIDVSSMYPKSVWR